MPLLCSEYVRIHWCPLAASLLATMFRTQSSSEWGDRSSHRLRLLLAMVVSVITYREMNAEQTVRGSDVLLV